MVEITHKGAWIKWSTLNARDRRWFVLSMVTTLPLGMAIGRAAAWSLGGATGWWLLTLGGWAGPFPLGAFVAASFALLCGFWFYAVRRWA